MPYGRSYNRRLSRNYRNYRRNTSKGMYKSAQYKIDIALKMFLTGLRSMLMTNNKISYRRMLI